MGQDHTLPHFLLKIPMPIEFNKLADPKAYVSHLWKTYVKTKDIKIRNELILFYTPLAEKLADYHARKTKSPYCIFTGDDFRQAAFIGLIDAIENFNADKKTKFETYANYRINGEILSIQRNNDYLSRLTRMNMTEIEQALERHRQEKGRNLDTDEMLEIVAQLPFMKTSKIPLHNTLLLANMQTIRFSECERRNIKQGDRRERFDAIDKKPDLLRENLELQSLLKFLSKGMPPRYKRILEMLYANNMTHKEIGAAIGCTESNVSRILKVIHAIIKPRIKKHLKPARLSP